MLRITVVAALCCVSIEAVSSSQNATKYRYQELNPNLQAYQDAWKSNIKKAPYVLAYRSFQDLPGTDIRRCVTGTLIAKHRNNRTAIHLAWYLLINYVKKVKLGKVLFRVCSFNFKVFYFCPLEGYTSS
uniref:Putative salivary lipocalin n=1 Tax=Ixodes ricinus TaxID=34613 RepID=A0A0K8R403_IXORI